MYMAEEQSEAYRDNRWLDIAPEARVGLALGGVGQRVQEGRVRVCWTGTHRRGGWDEGFKLSQMHP